MRFLSTLVASALGTLIALGILFLVSLLFIFTLVAIADQQPGVASESILVVELAGAIPEVVSGDPLAQAFGDEPAFGLHDLTFALEKAAADDRIDGVWLDIKGVSAPWATLQEVRDALTTFSESGKPIIASADDYMMAEQEYFLASAADSVFASAESLFELNGFMITVEFYAELLEKLDVEPKVVRAGKYKSAVEPLLRSELSPENEEQLTDLLESYDTSFIEAVAESRGMSADEVRRLATEQGVLTSLAAYEAGLLDGLLYEDEVRDVWRRRLGYEMENEEDEERDLRLVTVEKYKGISAESAGIEFVEDAEIAIVRAEGMILSGSGSEMFASPVVGAESFNRAMRQAREDDYVDAVVLRIDSPGGSASASDAMWREINLTSEVKPVIVSMGDVAASGGYWIATAGDTIVADPLTVTGSIGVFYQLLDVSGLFENKLGITFDEISTSPYADVFSMISEMDDQDRALLERAADETYTTFLQRVADNRGISVDSVQAIAQGRVWTGQHALEVGLVDELGGLDRAIEIAAEKAGLGEGVIRTRTLPRPKTFVERLNESLSAQVAAGYMHLRTTPIERAILNQARSLEHLALSHGTVQALMEFEIDVR